MTEKYPPLLSNLQPTRAPASIKAAARCLAQLVARSVSFPPDVKRVLGSWVSGSSTALATLCKPEAGLQRDAVVGVCSLSLALSLSLSTCVCMCVIISHSLSTLFVVLLSLLLCSCLGSDFDDSVVPASCVPSPDCQVHGCCHGLVGPGARCDHSYYPLSALLLSYSHFSYLQFSYLITASLLFSSNLSYHLLFLSSPLLFSHLLSSSHIFSPLITSSLLTSHITSPLLLQS